MSRLFRPGLSVVAAALWSAPCFAAEPATALDLELKDRVRPYLQHYCLDCHGEKRQEGKLDLSSYTSLAAVNKQHGIWEIVLERLEAREMPPEKAPRHPEAAETTQIIEWIRRVRAAEASRLAGDPGPVLARRLSNSEFDYTIRDLTHVDLRPTKEFPVDPANEAGFDNTGESLAMSPALLKKYLAAARFVADHIVLKPRGFVFAPHPVVTETDRDKFCVQRIVDFYQRHQVDFAEYFLAAWIFKYREELGQPNITLADVAEGAFGERLPDDVLATRLSARYLGTVWNALTEKVEVGPLLELQGEWNKLPAPVVVEHRIQQLDGVQESCRQLRELAVKLRKNLDQPVPRLSVKGNSDGSQPLVLWWNRETARRRMTYIGDGTDPALDAARARFCQAFPNTFSVSSRGHYADAKLGAGVRLLTAGFHLMQGYFRDDRPLYDLVLDTAGQRELDELWQELNFVTSVPFRQYKDFLFFERAEPPRFAFGPEFDFARPEDKDVTSEAKLTRMREAYLAKATRNDASPAAVAAINTYFDEMSRDFRWIEQAHLTAEASHLEDLVKFAERAYRRPLAAEERDDLLGFYRQLRGTTAAVDPVLQAQGVADGLNHEDAIRDCVASVLMSPHFCYRFDLKSDSPSPQPLSDAALASRLSYFLWSSMPDDELLAQAATGDLHQPEILVQQVRRMLRDNRVKGLAAEFAGNWLEFRKFEEHNSVDRDRFSTFTNDLRQAMYEEPLRFFMDLARENRSVLELLYADHTFVNPLLARHYGLNTIATRPDEWVRVDQAGLQGRGGLLAMSVFLTKNSPGLRTSPVKRGYWVVRRLLGEHIPAPPPDVPELPKDEAQLGELTLAQILAKHREHQSCAVCHVRFDAVGLVFEGYGPIGERRDLDLGGRPVNAQATFPNGTTGDGLEGLKRYLRDHREQDFLDNLSRKLLAYALGRSLILSDQATLDAMRVNLTKNEHRLGSLIETIVLSPQFLNHRGQTPEEAPE